MKAKHINILVCFWLCCFTNKVDGQQSGFVKTGLNFGTINQEWWTLQDSIKYDKALIRPIISFGGQFSLSKYWLIRQAVIFQIKGQGTIRPDVRSGFRTENPDILRFVSFPLSIHRKLFSNFYLGVSIQPSLYISGSDNYGTKAFDAKENWHGWIWGSTFSIQYFKEYIELGFEYDHDFSLYYCPNCGIRFYTYRIYGAYHFLPR